MAAFDLVVNINDPALKPRLLRKLLRESVPDDKRKFHDPSDMSMVVSTIKFHKLLFESVHVMDQKLKNSLKSSVDSWIDRLFILLSNNMPDKCWAGIMLLGVTCQECSTDRFLESYADWFHKLLPHLQADSQFLKVASCASISDLFSRLSGFQNVKKDGTSYAGKIIQPVLKLLHDENTEAVWDAAVNLLCTLIAFFPFSIHRHYDSAEAAIVSKFFSGKCSFNMLKKLAHCLALLPKSKGDEDWSLLMQKILLSIDCHLNEAFQGIVEDSKGNQFVRLLVPPGKEPPPPLGCDSFSGNCSDKITKTSERLLTSTVSTLMLCCSTMITTSYPYQVVVPIRPLLALIERVLMVDGSLPPTSLPFMTSLQQESMCSKLPTLHSDSFDLLIAIIKSLRSQLLPHAASIRRLIAMYFKKCVSSELRVKVYAVAKSLMISMGVGMAASLAQDVIDNALVDLNPVDNESCAPTNVNLKDTQRDLLQHHKKRKRIAVVTSLQEKHERHGSGGDVSNNYLPSPVSLRIAALEALETLLTLAGTMRSEGWRAKIDHLLITAASSSFKGPGAMDENCFQINASSEVWIDYQLAAFRALLASFLSAVHVRPLSLAQGLELFRRGKQETGTKLAEFCALALLAMEVLIHPRVLPLSDYTSAILSSREEANKTSEDMYFHGFSSSKSLKIDPQAMESSAPDSDDDDLYHKWVAVADGVEEAPVGDVGDKTNDGETTCNTSNDHGKGKNSTEGPSTTETPMRSEQATAAAISYVKPGATEKDDVLANASMNHSLMSSKSNKNEKVGRDQESNVLAEDDDFPDIVFTFRDSDSEKEDDKWDITQ